LVLQIFAHESLAPVATSFVEKSAIAFGLPQSDSLSLTLATEEVFIYLCRKAAPEKPIQLNSKGRGYYVEVEFLFHPREFNMKAFNLTSSVSLDSGAAPDETGLLIASRMVDRFRFHEDQGNLKVTFGKEKTYPEMEADQKAVSRPLDQYSTRPPEEGELKEFARLAVSYYAAKYLIKDFSYPGKILDMTRAGVYSSLVAVDSKGLIGGGIVWTFQTPEIVTFYGPYIFGQPQEGNMAEELVNRMIASVAKSRAVGIINLNPTRQLPEEYFESLGSLDFSGEEEGPGQTRVYYKSLLEDPGLVVWASPSMHDFLKEQYQRLCFAREILTVKDEGEGGSPYSVISAEFDKKRSSVVLRPIWWGSDASEAMAGNVAALKKEGIPNLFFHIDLGKPWQSHFTAAALSNGFAPRVILPHYGKADLLVFQLETRV
jgi:hypothetical protein